MWFQFTHSSCDDWENIYTLHYYHHQIGSIGTITHCLGLGHETMVRAVCLSIFLSKVFSGIKLRPISQEMLKISDTNSQNELVKYTGEITSTCLRGQRIKFVSKHVHKYCEQEILDAHILLHTGVLPSFTELYTGHTTAISAFYGGPSHDFRWVGQTNVTSTLLSKM